jgi:hypothetical protein
MNSEAQKQIGSGEDWRAEITSNSFPTLKIADGEEKKFVFLNEGQKREHPDFGDSIVFEIEHNNEKMNWFVRTNNFSLLKQIKDLGKITGLLVEVSRVGSKKSDTRYTIKKI